MNKFLFLTAVLLFLVIGTEARRPKFPPFFRGNRLKRLQSRYFDEATNYRLPNNTIPIHYDVHILTRVDSKDTSFHGSVKITVKVIEDTKNVVLHSRQLDITSAMIWDGSTEIECNYSQETKTDFLTITPSNNQTLTKGKQIVVEIMYNGELRDDMGGDFFH